MGAGGSVVEATGSLADSVVGSAAAAVVGSAWGAGSGAGSGSGSGTAKPSCEARLNQWRRRGAGGAGLGLAFGAVFAGASAEITSTTGVAATASETLLDGWAASSSA